MSRVKLATSKAGLRKALALPWLRKMAGDSVKRGFFASLDPDGRDRKMRRKVDRALMALQNALGSLNDMRVHTWPGRMICECQCRLGQDVRGRLSRWLRGGRRRRLAGRGACRRQAAEESGVNAAPVDVRRRNRNPVRQAWLSWATTEWRSVL